MTRIEVAPRLLEWAKDRAGLSDEDLAAAFPRYPDWVAQTVKPTLKQLEGFAAKAHVPLGYLFLDEPPDEPLPIADYRTHRDKGVSKASPELLDTLHTMIQRQAWMRDYLLEVGAEPLPFVGSSSVRDGVFSVAQAMRQTLGMSAGWARQYATWAKAFTGLLEICEDAGILFSVNAVVDNNTHRRLNPEEFRGFVLVDPYAPLVFINGADAKSAQMFTLAHQLAHIWLGQTSLFDIPALEAKGDAVEVFCNQVAAEFLVPESELRQSWPSYGGGAATFDSLARVFKVSPLAIGRRALELGLVDRPVFFAFYQQRVQQERKKPEGEGGGNFYATQRFRLGKPFAAAVVRSAQGGTLLYRDAYRLLGLRGPTFDHYAAELRLSIQVS